MDFDTFHIHECDTLQCIAPSFMHAAWLHRSIHAQHWHIFLTSTFMWCSNIRNPQSFQVSATMVRATCLAVLQCDKYHVKYFGSVTQGKAGQLGPRMILSVSIPIFPMKPLGRVEVTRSASMMNGRSSSTS